MRPNATDGADDGGGTPPGQTADAAPPAPLGAPTDPQRPWKSPTLPPHDPRVRRRPGRRLCRVALALNVLLPGVGTILAGRAGTGAMQSLLVVAGLVVLPASPLGFVLAGSAWLWAVGSGIRLLRGARTAATSTT